MSIAAARALTPPLETAIRAAREGDASAWDMLFDRFHGRVLRYAMARLGDADGAEDVMQEVFVAAVQSVSRLRDASEQGIEAWLLRITRHKVADRIRALRRERRTPESHTPAAVDPGDVALNRISVSELRGALDKLSDDQRDLILRRFVLDQSLEQVSVATRRPVGAVKSMQRRALASLARLCAEEAT